MDLLKILDGTPEPPIIDLQLEQQNTSGDYHLATPMYEFQKELTDQIVSLHYPDILKYCETNDTKDLIVKSLEICINNCMLVSTHPYLLINHYMPKNLLSKDMPNKLADTSGKFSVLKDLINVIISSGGGSGRGPVAASSLLKHGGKGKNIGIIMKNDVRFFDLVEALLLGCSGNKSIKRYVGQNVQRESKKTSKDPAAVKETKKNGKGTTATSEIPAKETRKSKNSTSVDTVRTRPTTTIHLLPYDGVLQKDQEQLDAVKFDTLIVFDGYSDTSNDFFNKVRTQNRDTPSISIRLVPMKTIEHCKIYYSDDKDKPDYIYKLISSIVCLREFIGNLPPDIFPIYNQKLTYLGSKFFDLLGKNGSRGVSPSWPLPDLPSIPKFNANDVERSLLTEVHFHYTPYDTSDQVAVNNDKLKNVTKKRTYYEMKRLESDYVSNPLKNDYNSLIGIHSNTKSHNHAADNLLSQSSILTHKHIMTLNTLIIESKLVEDEYASYQHFENSREHKIGRETDLSKTKSILDDIDHAQSRISSSRKWSEKKAAEVDALKDEIKQTENKIKDFATGNNITDTQKLEFLKNQLEIWNLQGEIKDYLQRIKSKNEEKNYMSKEYENSLKSIAESESQIESVEGKITETREKLDTIIELQVKEDKIFKAEKEKLDKKIRDEKLRHDSLKLKVSSSLKFLKDTSHLKKRKGRAFTPSK